MVILSDSSDDQERELSRRLDHVHSDALLKDIQQHLNQKLQTSLDLNGVLNLYFEILRSYVRVDGMIYTSKDTSLIYTFGDAKPHSAQYKISTDAQHLGNISFSREQPFSETELKALEILVGSLFYPLRNALLYRQAVQSSMRDPLTNVGNRTALSQALTREVELAKRFHRPFSILLIDVDHFKRINDTVGHTAGDLVLQHLVDRITSSLRQIDEVFRYGGEEFVVLLSNTDNRASLLVAERIRQVLANKPLYLEDDTLSITVSIGLSAYQQEDSEESLFDRADQALYQAKRHGRNQVVQGEALSHA